MRRGDRARSLSVSRQRDSEVGGENSESANASVAEPLPPISARERRGRPSVAGRAPKAAPKAAPRGRVDGSPGQVDGSLGRREGSQKARARSGSISSALPSRAGSRVPQLDQQDNRSISSDSLQLPLIRGAINAPGGARISTGQVVACFRSFDENGDGKITREDLFRVMKMLDRDGSFSDSEVEMIMDAIDKNRDGIIDYSEFTAWVKGEVSPSAPDAPSKLELERMKSDATPEEKLERCLEELEMGKRAAKPPRPLELTLRWEDLWIFAKKGQTVEDARVATGATRVRQVDPGGDMYQKGLRLGWRVVVIGGLAVDSKSNSLDRMMRSFGGGGGKARTIEVGFVSPQALDAQLKALEKLKDLQAAVDAAVLECKKEEGDGGRMMMPEAVFIKYYDYKGLFPTSSNSLAAAEIDCVYRISRLMPDCSFHLASHCPRDVHIMDREQVNLLELSSELVRMPMVEEEKSDGGTASAARTRITSSGKTKPILNGVFTDLVHGETYFLIVEPGRSTLKADAEWRERMQRAAWLERVSNLPVHDCEKELVPYSYHVKTHVGEYEISIDNREARLLGINTVQETDGTSLRVEDVLEVGLVHNWNITNPQARVKVGDRIMEINGRRNDADVLSRELLRREKLQIKLRRYVFEVGDSVRALFKNGQWYSAEIVRDNKDHTFTIKWFDGRDEDRIKGPFDLQKEDEMQDICHAKCNGEYMFFGSQNGRVMYRNHFGATMNFHGCWRINLDPLEPMFNIYWAPGETGLRPPRRYWHDPDNYGNIGDVTLDSGIVSVCRICTPPARFEDT